MRTYVETNPIEGLTKREVAERLSAKLWNLRRPDAVKNPDDVTRFLFAIQPHPNIENDWIIQITDTETINKHPQADSIELVDFATVLSEAEKTQLSDYINQNNTLSVDEILTSLRDQVLSYPIWDDFEVGYEFGEDDKVALMEQSEDSQQLVFYEIIQSHRKQSDRNPSNTPALWSKITVSGDIEVWSQPIGGDGRYAFGAIVTHNGKTWKNVLEGQLNVWEPGVVDERFWVDIGENK